MKEGRYDSFLIEIDRIEKPFGALGGVAVIATNTWAAFEGKKALKIQQTNGSWDQNRLQKQKQQKRS